MLFRSVIETPKELFFRVAKNIALGDLPFGSENFESTTQSFFEALNNLEIVPASPILMNAGTSYQQLFSDNVFQVDDTMDGIFETLKKAAIIHQHGGGCGFSFSSLRPRGDEVAGMKNVAFGPITVMKIFDVSFGSIKQGGRRPGANMGVLSVFHPDIMEFITCKEEGILKNFNVSVGVTADFFSAVKEDKEIELINPRTKTVTEKVSARELFDAMCETAWRFGDPGLLFFDEINGKHPFHPGVESTGSCGQMPLLPNEGCPFAHINLSRVIKKGEIDYNRLLELIKLGVHFLDNCIEINHYLFPEVEKTCRHNRKIGLGIMGFADVLFKLRIPYDSEKCLNLIKKIMTFIRDESRKASAELAKKRGVFPGYEQSTWKAQKMPLRNATITTIAPTGTTSLIGNTSPGIEPVFALSQVLKTAEGEEIVLTHPEFKKAVKDLELSEDIYRKVGYVRSIKKMDMFPEEVRKVFVTSLDISPEWHIKVQAAFQEYVDSAISKTINLPKSATVEDVKKAYLLAFERKCKGITIYRDGSREDQVISLGRDQMKLESFQESGKR